MKKLLRFLLIFVCLLLCGCSAKEVATSNKQEYIVASLGFDKVDGKIKMLIESIVVNTDDLSEEKGSRLISGVGTSVNEAYSEIISQITQPLSLDHNAVTVIGRGITPSQIEEIFDFCRENTEINVAAMLVFSDNAQKLLSSKAVSSVAVGFDIMSMIEVTQEQKGTFFKNRFYEVESLNAKPLKTFCMPYFAQNEDTFFVNGLAVFKNNKMVKTLSNEEIPAFCLGTDTLGRGENVINGVKSEVKFSKVTYDFSFDNKLKITVNARVKGKNVAVLKEKTEKLLKNEDIFGIGNIISQMKPKIWEKIGESYADYYKNAEIKVNIYE